MKFAILALVAVANATIADGADCAKAIDPSTKKPKARVACKEAASCCSACMPGAKAKAKDAKTKQ